MLEDIMLDNKHYDAKRIVLDTLPNGLKLCPYLPVYKYLNSGSFYKDGKYSEEVAENIRKYANNEFGNFVPQILYNQIERVEKENNKDFINSTKDFPISFDVNKLLLKTAFWGKESVSSEELKEFIIENIQFLHDREFKFLSSLRKLIRIYDWLIYSPDVD